MKTIVRHYSTIASTLALAIALTGAGAWAAGKITSEDIKNGTIRKVDLRKNAVTPQKVKFPRARAIQGAGASAAAAATVADTFEPVAQMGTYKKLDAGSVLQVTWSGTADSGDLACIFQLRVDGQPPAGGGGEVYLRSGATLSVSVQALFSGLGAGEHSVEIYARMPDFSGTEYPCTVNPPAAQIEQTVNAAELVQ